MEPVSKAIKTLRSPRGSKTDKPTKESKTFYFFRGKKEKNEDTKNNNNGNPNIGGSSPPSTSAAKQQHDTKRTFKEKLQSPRHKEEKHHSSKSSRKTADPASLSFRKTADHSTMKNILAKTPNIDTVDAFSNVASNPAQKITPLLTVSKPRKIRERAKSERFVLNRATVSPHRRSNSQNFDARFVQQFDIEKFKLSLEIMDNGNFHTQSKSKQLKQLFQEIEPKSPKSTQNKDPSSPSQQCNEPQAEETIDAIQEPIEKFDIQDVKNILEDVVVPTNVDVDLPNTIYMTEEERIEAEVNRTRSKIAEELVSSEKSYVDFLAAIQHHLIMPLKDNVPSRKPIISQVHMKIIFSNWTSLLYCHINLLKVLKLKFSKWDPNQTIADVFVDSKMNSFFQLYKHYVNNYERSTQKLISVRNKNVQFSKFIVEVEDKIGKEKLGGGLKLESFLIMPVQRIPRYFMLVDTLLKNTKPEHPDYDNLIHARDQFQSIATLINESKRNTDKLDIAKKECSQIHGFPTEMLLSTSGVSLLKSGELWNGQINLGSKFFVILLNNSIALSTIVDRKDKDIDKDKYKYKLHLLLYLKKIRFYLNKVKQYLAIEMTNEDFEETKFKLRHESEEELQNWYLLLLDAYEKVSQNNIDVAFSLNTEEKIQQLKLKRKQIFSNFIQKEVQYVHHLQGLIPILALEPPVEEDLPDALESPLKSPRSPRVPNLSQLGGKITTAVAKMYYSETNKLNMGSEESPSGPLTVRLQRARLLSDDSPLSLTARVRPDDTPPQRLRQTFTDDSILPSNSQQRSTSPAPSSSESKEKNVKLKPNPLSFDKSVTLADSSSQTTSTQKHDLPKDNPSPLTQTFTGISSPKTLTSTTKPHSPSSSPAHDGPAQEAGLDATPHSPLIPTQRVLQAKYLKKGIGMGSVPVAVPKLQLSVLSGIGAKNDKPDGISVHSAPIVMSKIEHDENGEQKTKNLKASPSGNTKELTRPLGPRTDRPVNLASLKDYMVSISGKTEDIPTRHTRTPSNSSKIQPLSPRSHFQKDEPMEIGMTHELKPLFTALKPIIDAHVKLKPILFEKMTEFAQNPYLKNLFENFSIKDLFANYDTFCERWELKKNNLREALQKGKHNLGVLAKQFEEEQTLSLESFMEQVTSRLPHIYHTIHELAQYTDEEEPDYAYLQSLDEDLQKINEKVVARKKRNEHTSNHERRASNAPKAKNVRSYKKQT